MTTFLAHWHAAIPGALIVFVAWALWKLCGVTGGKCKTGSDDDR
jgi:hypothetical protein